MKKIFVALLLCFTWIAASANTLSPAGQLNRLSKRLRGYAPTSQEQRDLARAVELKRAPEFLSRKTDEYLASEDHAFKMNYRLEELFRVTTNAAPLCRLDSPECPELNQGGASRSFKYPEANALNHLFLSLARGNLSWDTLLTGKSYRLYDTTIFSGFALSDYGFMAALVPDLHSATGVYDPSPYPDDSKPLIYRDVQFDPQDSRIAGSLTTARFLYRYVNTGLNKNRRRAAAIFRIFLCDSMSASIPSSEGQEGAIFDQMFPHDPSMTEGQIRESAQNDQLHGSRPDCMACHSKLDPMGRTMITSPLALSPTAAPGMLTYKRGNEKVAIPVSGIGDLGRAITEQPEYVRCQVRQFWNWFVDERLKLTPEKENFLIGEFNRVGRRTNDFVKVILAQPEFSNVAPPLTQDEITANRIRVFLRKCQDCHKDQEYDGSPDGKFPDFTVWPIGGSPDSMQAWTRKIARAMDLDHDGENPRMPPTEAAWRTSFGEAQMIQTWIGNGAPDDKGRKQVQP